jgi:hypothetical protein
MFNSIPNDEFDLSAIEDFIVDHASMIFCDWLQALPSADRQRVDAPEPGVLEKMLRAVFCRALTACMTEDFLAHPGENAQVFLLGFVQGNLSSAWTARFLLGSDVEVLSAMWNRMLFVCAQEDDELLAKIEQRMRGEMKRLRQDDTEETANPWAADEPEFPVWHAVQDACADDLDRILQDLLMRKLGPGHGKVLRVDHYFPMTAVAELLRANYIGQETGQILGPDDVRLA